MSQQVRGEVIQAYLKELEEGAQITHNDGSDEAPTAPAAPAPAGEAGAPE